MTDGFVITGIGVVSASGVGKDEFWNALISGKSGLKQITYFDTSQHKSHLGGEIKDFDLDAILPDKRFRRAANISKYALASAKLAIDDAGLVPNKWDSAKAGLVVGVTHGAINYSREFHASLVKEGSSAASPMLFSDSVLNAPSGNVSIAFNIKGAAHTIIGGGSAGLDVIAYAIKAMQNNNLDVCVAGGAEEMDSIVFDSYARFKMLSPNNGKKEGIKPFGIHRNGFVIGEGACMLVIEKKKSAIDRKARIYAEIDAHVKKEEIKGRFAEQNLYISTGANGTENDRIEAELLQGISAKKTFVGNIKLITGECFAASGLMQTALAAMVIQKGIVPPSIIDYALMPEMDWAGFNHSMEKAEINTAIVSSTGFEGKCSFLALKRYYE